MRPIVVVALLVSAPLLALAADPPGGPGWYQAIDGFNVSVVGKGTLIIAADTPGQLVGVTTGGLLTIRFERGIALWLGTEITSDPALTISVPPTTVRAFIKQPLSRLGPGQNPGPGRGVGGGPGTLGPLGSSGTFGGGNAVGVQRDTVVTLEDTTRVVRTPAPEPLSLPPRPGAGPSVLPPSTSAPGGSTGGNTRVISREEHDARLRKLLALLGEDGATCETKGYGPGWISICEPRPAA